jgi:hypothetical protein
MRKNARVSSISDSEVSGLQQRTSVTLPSGEPVDHHGYQNGQEDERHIESIVTYVVAYS